MNDAVSPARSTTLGWIVFCLVVAILPAEVGWYGITGSEPYPALNQPPFHVIPGADGVFRGQATSLAVILSDGTAVPIDKEAFFSDSKNQAPSVVMSLAASPDLDPTARQKLRAELSRLVPGREVLALRIDTQRRIYLPKENSRYPASATKTTTIDLAGAP